MLNIGTPYLYPLRALLPGPTPDFFFGSIVMAVLIHIQIGRRVANARALLGKPEWRMRGPRIRDFFFVLWALAFAPRPSVLIALKQLLGGPGVPFGCISGSIQVFF